MKKTTSGVRTGLGRAAALATAALLLAPPPARAAGLQPGRSQLFQQGAGGLPGEAEGLVSTLLPGDQFGSGLESGDFNCDGRDDLAIAAPNEDIAYHPVIQPQGPGEVYVLYGTEAGVGSAGVQVLRQEPRHETEFGSALAAGDFTGDGCDDLAVGAPKSYEEDAFEGVQGGGSVTVFYGSRSGLGARFEYDQNTGAIPGGVEIHDQFGAALAAGNFDNDDYDDLAIGIPGEDNNSGAVVVLYGSPGALGTGGSTLWDQNSDYMPGGKESGDRFGAALDAADFNRDGHDDLAIGVPGEDDNAGAVVVMYGWTNGLRGENGPPGPNGNQDAQLFQQGAGGMVDRAEGNALHPDTADGFGTELTTGDLNGDGYQDLAIGVPGEEHSGAFDSGAVHVLYGWATGLQAGNGPGIWGGIATGNQFVPSPVAGRFGSALDSADFDGDGVDDLAVGIPLRNFDFTTAGEVWVIRGSRQDGVLAANAEVWTQTRTGAGGSEEDDFFGACVETGDFDGDGAPDLAIGVPREDLEAGAVNVVYGVTVDTTPPEIVPVIPQSPSASGWYRTTVEVSWLVGDPHSAVTSRSGCDPATIDTDTAGRTLTCTATSGGGTATASVVIRRDTVPPTLTAQRSAAPSASGWHRSPVSVSFLCADTLSGVAACPPSVLYTAEGGGQPLSGLARDRAGNLATFTDTVNIDMTPPVLVSGGPYLANEGDVIVLDASGSRDALSGLAELTWYRAGTALGPNPADQPAVDDGRFDVAVFGLDGAGNPAAASTTVEVLNVPPTADAGSDTEIATGDPVRLEGRFDDPGALDTHTIRWDFGDGATAEGSLSPDHTWTSPGEYTVRLTVADDDGGVGSDELSVRVACPPGFVERFDAYGPGTYPDGWVGYRYGRHGLDRAHAFRTVRVGDEVHYESRYGLAAAEYRSEEALLWHDYEYTGRFTLTKAAAAGVGLLVHADLASGRGLVAALVPGAGTGSLSARVYVLRGTGEHGLLEHADFVPGKAGWHNFRVRVEAEAQGVRVRVRFWHAEAQEPAEWNVEAFETQAPPYAGMIGVAARHHGVRFDDLRVEPLGPGSGISGDRDGDGVCDATDE